MAVVCCAFELEWEEQTETGFNEQVIDGMSGFVFKNRYGNVHNPQSINDAIERIANSYNAEEVIKAAREKREPLILPEFSCHNLRHTFATRLTFDANKMQRVFDNLLRNAVNYSFDNSTIRISAMQIENDFCIKFVNCGNTIPGEKLEHIFEQFYRLDTSRSSRSGEQAWGLLSQRK